MKIIIVDDNAAALHTFFDKVINETSNEYFYFQSAVQAWEFAQTNLVDGAFLDIDMPHIDGIMLTEKLISTNNKVSIIFITALSVDQDELLQQFPQNLLGVCNKPFDKSMLKNYSRLMKEKHVGKSQVNITMFKGFDVSVDGKPIAFLSGRSKELLAILVDANGQYCTMFEVITKMWPDNHIESAKRLYRDAVCKLRMALNSAGLGNLVQYKRAALRIVKGEHLYCDYWDAIEKKQSPTYIGQYASLSYEWIDDTINFLDRILKSHE